MNPKVVRYVPENKDLAASSEEFRFYLKLKEVARDGGLLDWVLDKKGGTLASTFGREESSSPRMRSSSPAITR
jgi:hypothetical protein